MGTNMMIGASIGSTPLGTLLNPEPEIPEGAILTEDRLFYLITEDGLKYLKQETEA